MAWSGRWPDPSVTANRSTTEETTMTTATTNQPATPEMIATEQNAELLRAGYAAFARGDLAAMGEIFSPDAVWHVQRLGILSGDHVGFPAILQFFGRTMEISRGTFRIDILEVLANENSSAAVVRSQGQRDGLTLDDRQIQHFHIRDGRVVEVWQYPGDVEAASAFWS
jgi:ketosteroid isomerase-like protein